MTSVAVAVKDFEKMLERNCAKPKKSRLEEICRHVDSVSSNTPEVYDDERIGKYLRDRAKVLKQLAGEYMDHVVSTHLPLIDPALFKMQRYITIATQDRKQRVVRDALEPDAKKGDQKKIVVPLFAYTTLFEGEPVATLGSYTKERRGSFGERYRSTTKITAKLGDVPQNMVRAYQQGVAEYFQALSEVYAKPVIGQVLLQEGVPSPKAGAIWIPSLDSLKLEVSESLIAPAPSRDPALVLTAGGKHYLIATWDAINEEPFEHYIREYTTGSIKDKMPERRR